MCGLYNHDLDGAKEAMREYLFEHGFEQEELDEMTEDEMQNEIDEIEDTSAMHPNESFDEFMEHEDLMED